MDHEFVPNAIGTDECAVLNCGLPARAGTHLIGVQPTLDKQLIMTLTATGMNIAVNGDFLPGDYALMGVIISDMAIQALRAATVDPHALTRDHLKKVKN